MEHAGLLEGIAKSSKASYRKRARRKARLFLEFRCSRCQYSPRDYKFAAPHLTVHHIDGDVFNNDISNLIFLCTLCHAITHKPNDKARFERRIISRDRKLRRMKGGADGED